MKKNTYFSAGFHFLKLFVIAALIFAAMCLCVLFGFSPAEKKASPEPTDTVSANRETQIPENEKYVFGNSDEYIDTTASAPQENVTAKTDEYDYLVISENEKVKLYFLTKDGEKIYSKDLEISMNSLMYEDKILLKNGIILNSEDALAALLEDYTS